MVDDVIDQLPTNKPLRIIDFGCGRSYLTFALYHYMTQVKKQEVTILGLDLKVQVIEDCNTLSKECGYEHLSFKQGDIIDYESVEDIDMVVTLHACNTATDIALKKAVSWNAKVILSVPCCQHELNAQIHAAPLEDLFQYGIIKERTAALFTDAMRANWLKLQGYEVQILEFIDVAHTPKNLLIRGVKQHDVIATDIDYSRYDAMQEFLNSDLTLRKL
jgi:SAM-dependent methyltransferase